MEVRKVPADWQHPVSDMGRYSDGSIAYVGLFADYRAAREMWLSQRDQWSAGLHELQRGIWEPIPASLAGYTYEEVNGAQPVPEDFMPDWPPAECTHFQMYETCTEGSPISPPFESVEALCHWLVLNKVSCFGKSRFLTYEQWLSVASGAVVTVSTDAAPLVEFII